MVVVVPLIVRLPATVRSFSTTTSELNVVSTSTVRPLESLVLIVLPTNSNTVLYVISLVVELYINGVPLAVVLIGAT